jgi:hypothetical protein
LKNLLLKLSGVEGEASAEASASRTQTEQSTRVQTTEQTLLKLRTFLTESGEGSFFTDLAAAMRRVAASGEPAFIGIRDKFNAPQFYGGAIGSDSVNAAGYLAPQKGGPSDYSDADDYHKKSTASVTLSASTAKMRSAGMMAATSKRRYSSDARQAVMCH